MKCADDDTRKKATSFPIGDVDAQLLHRSRARKMKRARNSAAEGVAPGDSPKRESSLYIEREFRAQGTTCGPPKPPQLMAT
jgi:hypothetical protein